jgi:translocation and assembly module TamA
MLLWSLPLWGAAAVEAPAETSADMPAHKAAAPPADAEAGKPSASGVKLDIEITGIEGELLKNAQAYLGLQQKKDDPLLSALWIRHLYKKSVEEIRKSLQPFGYYNARVKASLEQQGDDLWRAHFDVQPGPRTRIAELDLKWLGEGAEEDRLQEALQEFPLKKGDYLDDAVYEKGKTALISLAEDLGYPDAQAGKAQVVVDPRDNTARVTLHLDTGKKYYIDSIRLHQDILNEDFVRRYLVDVKPGDVYSQDNLLEIQRALIEAGYFSLVGIKPRFDEVHDSRVPVDVKLEPGKRQLYSIGLGYDTDIGVNLSLRWSHRRLNRKGHKADAQLKLSMNNSYLLGNYWIPIRDPRTTKLGFSARIEHEVLDNSESDLIDVDAGYYWEKHDWLTKFYTEFKYEKFTVGEEPAQTTHFLSLGATVQRTWRAAEKKPYLRQAWAMFADLSAAPSGISSTYYLRTHLKGRAYVPLLGKGRLIMRGEYGTATVGDFDLYPTSLRFYAGGDSSVRGYDWKTLGPEDEQGNVIGGRQVVTGSLEYDHQVARQWLAAGFVDAGNAYNDVLDHVFVGAGFGARWLSPVGTVRLDLAWPLNKENDEPTSLSDVRVHFGFEVLM